jgi:hypothetical protein
MECVKCQTYVHDTIESCPSHLFVRDSIRKHAAAITPEFMRFLWRQDTMVPLALLTIELGLVKKPRKYDNAWWSPFYVASSWIHEQNKRIGNIRGIHAEHSLAIESTDDLYS